MRRAALGLRGRRGARSLHVAVVGGGVVGVSTADELLRRGCEVTLLEATLFSLSHLLKTSQSTDARSEAFGKGGACGVKASEPHLYLLASLRRPICEWIHLSNYLDEPLSLAAF